jgi:VanZ family protein
MKQRIDTIFFYSSTAALILLTLFSLIPKPPEVVRGLLVVDKLMHTLSYFFVALGFMLSRKFPSVHISIILAVYGTLIEVLQVFTGRRFDTADMLANFIGIFLAFLLYHLIQYFITNINKGST